jgi:hypothetical protein
MERGKMRITYIKRVLKSLVCGFLFFLVFTPYAESSIILDQITVDMDTATQIAYSAVGKVVEYDWECETAQTVTAGISGFLSKIDIWVGCQSDTTGEMTLDVLNAGISLGTDEPLASVSIPTTLISSTNLSMVTLDVRSSNIFFNAGDSFAIALSAPNAQTELTDLAPFHWATEGPGQYEGGLRFYRDLQTGSSWLESSGADQALRTWMEPTAIPEPTTLMLLGLGGLLIRRER